MDINASRGMQSGATEDKIRAVEQAATSPLFDETERAVLAYAEAMTITGQRVSDELFARVRKHFSEPQVVELTAAVALENFRNKFNVALGVEAQGFCIIRSSSGDAQGPSRSTTAASPPSPSA
jgi:alkylhydroperoxidase family enzyme